MWVHCIWYIFHLWSLLELELMLAPLGDALRLCVPTKDDAEADDSSTSGEFQLYPNIPFMKLTRAEAFCCSAWGCTPSSTRVRHVVVVIERKEGEREKCRGGWHTPFNSWAIWILKLSGWSCVFAVSHQTLKFRYNESHIYRHVLNWSR